MNTIIRLLIALTVTSTMALGQTSRSSDQSEATSLISNARQLTFEGRRAGEGYFSADGTKMVFQSERDAANPFYQIYRLDMETGDVERISPGHGKTTCAWLHPDGNRVLYASTHLDPRSKAFQQAELDFRASGKSRRYEWDYDENFELFAHDRKTGKDHRLTIAPGYDAEGSYSPDGQWVCFASNRSAYLEPMSDSDQRRFEKDRALFMDIYIMKADGSQVKRLTYSRGYDGGPFFSADGKRVCWRRFSEDGLRAEIYTMNTDGSDQRRLTYLEKMSWAPYFHPSGEYLIFTTNRHGFDNFELYIVDPKGEHEPVRVSDKAGFDGLPSFTPNGKMISWTSNSTKEKLSQIFIGQWDHASALKLLKNSPKRQHAAKAQEPTSRPKKSIRAMPMIRSLSTVKVSAADLAKHTAFLASEGMQGRLTGTEGEKKATAYVAREFKLIGLLPGGNSAGSDFYQPFRANMMSLDGKKMDIMGRNVIGVLKADAKYANAAPLIIGAHVDHLGTEGGRYSRAKGEGKQKVHLGADDNASGVAGLIEIAQYLTHLRDKKKIELVRDVHFAAWSGEEIGLFGSKHFVRDLKKRLGRDDLKGQVAAYLNMDMIGRLRDNVIVSGVGSSSVWPREIERRNAPVGLSVSLVMDCNLPTDTSGFFLNGVPILSIFTGAHEDYHTPEDTIEHIDFYGMEKIVRFVALMSRSLATKAANPDFIAYAEKKKTQKKGSRPYLGTIPDYAGPDGGKGVLLDGVAKNGPAWNAGVRGGDVIIGLNGEDIGDIYDYTAALEELTVDEETDITVLRDGKKLSLKLKPGARE